MEADCCYCLPSHSLCLPLVAKDTKKQMSWPVAALPIFEHFCGVAWPNTTCALDQGCLRLRSLPIPWQNKIPVYSLGMVSIFISFHIFDYLSDYYIVNYRLVNMCLSTDSAKKTTTQLSSVSATVKPWFLIRRNHLHMEFSSYTDC